MSKSCVGRKPNADSKTVIHSGKIYFMVSIKGRVVLFYTHRGLTVNLIASGGLLAYR
jgi:hypothetical protein